MSGHVLLDFLTPGWLDTAQIALVALVLYRLLLLLRGTRVAPVLLGGVLLVLAYAAAWLLHLRTLTYLLGLVFTYGPIAAVIVFQPELRQALAQFGQGRGGARLTRHLPPAEVAEVVADAVGRLAGSGIGAIIALERQTPLGDFVQSGSEMDARVSADLLATIFTPYSPLHDGAVIIRGETIVAAGCILPLSQAQLHDRSLGTRHRAALGLAEETDAVVVIVSEETATVSVAMDGALRRRLTPAEVREILAGRRTQPAPDRVVAE